MQAFSTYSLVPTVRVEWNNAVTVKRLLELGAPGDIAADIGKLGKPMDPDVWDLIKLAAKRLIERGIPVGTPVLASTFAAELQADAFTFVACGTDTGLLAKGSDQSLSQVRGTS